MCQSFPENGRLLSQAFGLCLDWSILQGIDGQAFCFNREWWFEFAAADPAGG